MKVRAAAAVLVLLVLGACGTVDPTDAIRARLADAERAAEARDTGFFRDLLAEGYRDDRGNDRAAAIQLVRGFFLANQKVEIVSHVEQVTLEGSDAARVVVQAGLGGQRSGASLLGGLHGDLYRFRLELVNEDGDWRIIGAQWQRALGE